MYNNIIIFYIFYNFQKYSAVLNKTRNLNQQLESKLEGISESEKVIVDNSQSDDNNSQTTTTDGTVDNDNNIIKEDIQLLNKDEHKVLY